SFRPAILTLLLPSSATNSRWRPKSIAIWSIRPTTSPSGILNPNSRGLASAASAASGQNLYPPAKVVVNATKNAATFISPKLPITPDDRDGGPRRATAPYLHATEKKVHISDNLLRKLRLQPGHLKSVLSQKSRGISEATFRNDHESRSSLVFQPVPSARAFEC